MKFSNILKELRAEKGLTQIELASALGITRSRLSMYETGDREPDFETLELIADYFNIDIDYLLGRTEKTTRLLDRFSLPEDKTEEAKAGDELSPAARELIDLMHQLEPEQIGLLLAFAKALLHRPQGS